jgi:selenocysteine lyase/cysteine desulfurase
MEGSSFVTFDNDLLTAIRDRFHHTDTCPIQGPRAFFENAGGSLTLKAAVERTAELMAFPDNQGRTNEASKYLMEVIAQGRTDMKLLLGASTGEVFIGESGTELLGRLVRNAIFAGAGSLVIGSHLEHPATYSPCRRWAPIAGMEYMQVQFDADTTVVSAEQYRPAITPDLAVATIIHASPVTGMHVDIAAIAAEIRAVAADCFIIVDGIQHAAHGRVDIDDYGIDGYVVSGYKLFSRHNFGVAWVSDRLANAPHDQLAGAPANVWELGTRDTSAYAAFSEVVRYLEWLGAQVTGNPSDSDEFDSADSSDAAPRELIERAAVAIHDQEQDLVDAMMWGTGGLPGLGQLDNVSVVGPTNSEHRSGMVSFTIDGHDSLDVVDALNADGVRTHARKQDYYSRGVLEPLGLENCVRASASHYNSRAEVELMLATVNRLAGS